MRRTRTSHDDHLHHDASREHRHDGPVPLYDRGLAFDVGTLLGRRQMLGLVAAAGVVPILRGLDVTSSSQAAALVAACRQIPEETAGPYPGDGSNGPNVLDDVGIVRRDIRASYGGADGVADGVELKIRLTVLDQANGCAPYAGAAVYLWHCDRPGRYSLYSPGVTGENYLRGVQECDADGVVRFTSIFPGCYPGRWPHAHFEVYPSLEDATSFENKIATSQLALRPKECRQVYATDGYEASAQNLAHVSRKTDMVFRDGWALETPTMTGSVGSGFRASLSLAV